MPKDTRARIVEAATALVRERGLGALSVRSVASAAGLAPTTLRGYFPSQAQLYSAVASEFVSVTLSDQRVHDEEVSPVERLHECMRQFLPEPEGARTALEGWFEYYRLSFGPEGNTAVRELLVAGRHASLSSIEGWLTVLAQQGHRCRRGIPQTAAGLLSVIDGLHLSMLADPELLSIDDAHDVLRDHVSASLHA